MSIEHAGRPEGQGGEVVLMNGAARGRRGPIDAIVCMRGRLRSGPDVAVDARRGLDVSMDAQRGPDASIDAHSGPKLHVDPTAHDENSPHRGALGGAAVVFPLLATKSAPARNSRRSRGEFSPYSEEFCAIGGLEQTSGAFSSQRRGRTRADRPESRA